MNLWRHGRNIGGVGRNPLNKQLVDSKFVKLLFGPKLCPDEHKGTGLGLGKPMYLGSITWTKCS